MAQPGCTYGQHVWIQKKDVDRSFVQCRYDWHQTAKDVIVSIYAKKYHYAHSKIKVSPIRLQVSLVFPEQNGAVFKLDIELEGVSLWQLIAPQVGLEINSNETSSVFRS